MNYDLPHRTNTIGNQVLQHPDRSPMFEYTFDQQSAYQDYIEQSDAWTIGKTTYDTASYTALLRRFSLIDINVDAVVASMYQSIKRGDRVGIEFARRIWAFGRLPKSEPMIANVYIVSEFTSAVLVSDPIWVWAKVHKHDKITTFYHSFINTVPDPTPNIKAFIESTNDAKDYKDYKNLKVVNTPLHERLETTFNGYFNNIRFFDYMSDRRVSVPTNVPVTTKGTSILVNGDPVIEYRRDKNLWMVNT